MSYVLSFRRPPPPPNESFDYVHKHPGCRWWPYIPIEDKPINYLEIGVHKGTNIIDVAKSYAIHPDSKIHCVDPWMDYDEYPEYKGKQDVLFEEFKKNTAAYADRFIVHRGFSDDIVPTFEDNSFDIIYIDGNHETEYVYRDGCMSIEKVKPGGYIIFDDYYSKWKQTVIGIDRVLDKYASRIQIINRCTPGFCQVIIRKL